MCVHRELYIYIYTCARTHCLHTVYTLSTHIPKYPHTHIHTHIHTYTHTDIQTYTHPHIHTSTHTHIDIRVREPSLCLFEDVIDRHFTPQPPSPERTKTEIMPSKKGKSMTTEVVFASRAGIPLLSPCETRDEEPVRTRRQSTRQHAGISLGGVGRESIREGGGGGIGRESVRKHPYELTHGIQKWRRWHEPSHPAYIGDKYPDPDHDPYEEGEEEEEEEAGK